MTVTAPDRGQVPAMTTLDLVRFGASMLYMAPGEALGRVQDRHNAPAVRLPGWTAPLPMILGLRQVLLSADPAFAECVALNQEHTLSNASGWGPALARFGMFTRSLLQMDFDEHRYDRLLMQQAMTPERLTSYLDQVAPKFRDAVRGLPTGDGVDMRKLFKRTNMRLVIEVFMGINLPPEEVDKVGKAFDDLVSVNTLRQTLARRYLHRFLLSWVPAKRAAHTPDLMSEMCHARALDGAAYSDKQIMHHMMFFLFAAHDTTTITMTNMAYYLALNPHWQRRARAQAFEFPEDATRADFDKMTELQNIMKETLRFRTPVPLLIRASILDTDILGYRVPRKTGILALTWGITPIRRSGRSPGVLIQTGSLLSAPRTRIIVPSGCHSVAGCTSASACTLPRCRSSPCITRCCASSPGRSTAITSSRHWPILWHSPTDFRQRCAGSIPHPTAARTNSLKTRRSGGASRPTCAR